ncbi:ankyrin repeat domain-containing protein 16-like, partial [Pseudonaja textilis]|uniref:ankyrin repeat domain-containing protein 16-like n=1 Tax=Pseudonaja textilis TaxID=8673 RepID=UPI000EAA4942
IEVYLYSVLRFLRHPFSPPWASFWGYNPQIFAFCFLFPNLQADYKIRDALGNQPLHRAAITGQDDGLRFLVSDLGVEVDEGATDLGLTALHYAAKEEEEHLSTSLSGLLNVDFDNSQRDGNRVASTCRGATHNLHRCSASSAHTALHMASARQHTPCVHFLLQAGLKDSPDDAWTYARQLAKKTDLVQLFEDNRLCGSEH